MSEVWWWSAGRVAAAVRAGEVSAREVAAAHLERIEGVGAALNAVVVVDAERALTAAACVDDALRAGRDPGPLAGVPVTVKEAFAVEGLPTTAGMPELAGQVAVSDAPAVAALRRAGATILGKTNLPRQLADLQTDNPIYGRTTNPWDQARSPGGSSGGSAAAVAAGLCALDLGSDLSGSVRVPASWCGVYALRLSNGLVSKREHLPYPLGGLLEPPTSVVGPLARDVADLRLALAALTAAASGPGSPAGQGGSGRPVAPGRLRIGVWSEFPGAPVDEETQAVLAATADSLAAAGATVSPFSPPLDPATALALAWRLVDVEIIHGLRDEQWAGASAGGGRMAQTVRQHLADVESRLAITAAWDAAMADGWHAILCPAVGITARPHDPTPRAERTVSIGGVDHPFDALASWSVLVSIGHMPSVTFPAGRGSVTGLPVGLQLVGRHRHDADLLEVAATVAEVVGGWEPPPGW